MMLSDSAVHRLTGQWKASEVGIEGFHIFLKSLKPTERTKAWLLIPDRTLSDDIEMAKHLIESLDLEDRIVWLQGRSQEGLTRREMLPIYSRASATLDDFGVGWYGSVVVEAAACESPVVTYISDELLVSVGNPPILNARTPVQIAQHLVNLYRNSAETRAIGRKSRDWVKEFHSDAAVQVAYQRVLREIGLKPAR